MGALARALASHDETRQSLGEFLNADEDAGSMTSAGVHVSRKSLLGLTTMWRVGDLLSSSIGQAPRDIIVKINGQSFPEFNKPSWMVAPDPTDPTYTANDHFAAVALSLIFDGNFFTSCLPSIFEPEYVTVLDPSRVEVKNDGYHLQNEYGQPILTPSGQPLVLSGMQMLHGKWFPFPNTRRSPSVLESLRRAIGGAIAAEEHAARFFGQGASLSFGVEVPGALDKAQKDELGASLKKRYAGISNSHAIGVLTAGAKFITGLAPTPEQAQMLATRQFSVEDLCRPFGIPPHMVGSQQPGAVSYASVNGTLLEFKQYAVLPLAQRIEAQYNRLVSVPGNLSNTRATAQFKFNLDGIARADLLTRYQAYGEGVRGGFLTPNEARTSEDLAPKDARADQLYMQVQMQPIGTPVNGQPVPSNGDNQ